MRFLKIIAIIILFLFIFWPLSSTEASSGLPNTDEPEQPLIINFFRAHGCSYCEEANHSLHQLQGSYPQLEIHDFDVYLDADARLLYSQALDRLGRTAQGMPTIIIGNMVWVGFQTSYQQEIENALNACLAGDCPDIVQELNKDKSDGSGIKETAPTQSAPEEVNIPLIGNVSLTSTPLIMSTLIIAVVDGFNPCSLWVLTVLLSLTLYMQSRPKILLVGFTFILISALIYALFISGLFTTLSLIKYRNLIQILVSLVALVFAIINIKDYFRFKQGPSLSIPEKEKPALYQRMRQLITKNNAGFSLILGTVILSAGVSLIEFSCTAGFPIIWVNLLMHQQVAKAQYALLLTLYLFIYMIDELAIFASVLFSMRAVKLDESQGRFLKLLSGLVMLVLSGIMLIQPEMMNHLLSVLLIFGLVIGAAFLINHIVRRLAK